MNIRIVRSRWKSIASETFISFATLTGKKAWRVLPVEVNITEHGRGAVIRAVVQPISVRAREFLESSAAELGRVLWPLALAGDHRVVQVFEVDRAT